ncbi:putative dolichyl-diphosphooligosaccharide--protein glycosyltransferase subunit 3A [Frankliniella fusca]|uniref:Dolichyl-diphosphooligosaccharide--protein glycosyltransferase subunit 3A n=1 Tax=Frankliniella fusca TaxID=407009 RepID=A0AAE1HRU2_9NEOP|nr:putative dolichyl-diphosphooligosaccharide--protein glycosyltransferase subunit 3A [Frankliniella fusca]
MIMSQASNVLSLQTFGKCRLRDRTLWNKAMIFSSFFTSSGKVINWAVENEMPLFVKQFSQYGAFPTESLMEFHLNQAFILLSFKLRFKKTVGLLSLDLKAIMYDCSSILSQFKL